MANAQDAAPETTWSCEAPAGDAAPDYLEKIGCRADFDALSSLPLDASIPGARSGKVILDLLDDDPHGRLYFQNSRTFPIHYDFARAHLSHPSDPQRTIGSIGDFNPQYTLPEIQRRFLLGAVSYYEGPKVWVLEIAPYDPSTPGRIEMLFDAVRKRAYFGSRVKFHPTSENVQARADDLPASVPVLTTDELYQGIDYQPLNLGEALGPIRFVRSVDLDRSYVTTRDIVVLDAVPNDIAPVNGLLTEDFQTPLSHINVLARNRGTPNMGLRDAWAVLKAQGIEDGQHVRLTVGKFEVLSVTPGTGAKGNAVSVTINGNCFDPTALIQQVLVSGLSLNVLNVVVVDEHTVQCVFDIAALAASGPRDVTVKTGLFTHTLINGFTIS